MGLSDRHESGNFSAFITGALIGAGIALLFAPRSGSQMRGRLRDYAARVKDELDDAVDRGEEFLEKGKDCLREAGRQVNGLAEEGRKTVNDTKDELASPHR
jgi:gas vesicle protein